MSQGEIHPQGMNDILGMTLGPEHPGRVRGAGYGATITSYFHQPHGRRSSASNDEVKRLMDARGEENALRVYRDSEATAPKVISVSTVQLSAEWSFSLL